MLTDNEIDLDIEFREFANGPIYWSPATGAHPVVNSFLYRWGQNNYEAGWLHYPTTDEIVLPDGGRRQEFQDGVIFVAFQNAVGSAIRNGPLRDKYNTVGGLTPGSSFLGYPTQDQIITLPGSPGQMARFQNGVIYWHPTYGAYPVSGLVLAVWAANGYETGVYGYPVADSAADVTPVGSVTQNFQYDNISIAAQASGEPGNACENSDQSGCVPVPYDTLRACLDFTLDGKKIIFQYKDSFRTYLRCRDFRIHIAPDHFSDPTDITQEDLKNFRLCTAAAVVFGEDYQSNGRRTTNTTGTRGIVRINSDRSVSTAYTDEDPDYGNDWGGCVRAVTGG